ncbi:MAG TPA: flagellar basal body rod protein FlgC [Burkholderiales bacterium]
MDYLAAFAISGSGMTVEKMRLDVTAMNLANVNSSRGADGTMFQPLRVVSGVRTDPRFEAAMAAWGVQLGGAQVQQLVPTDAPPRMVLEPGHPDADSRGFVSYPGINPVAEMTNLITAVRTYEANVVALNAAKTMAQRALDIGGGGR